MRTQIETVTAEGLTLSTLIWRVLKRKPLGYTERVLAENPGLAALGPILPVGATIRFPMDDIAPPTRQTTAVRLWD